MLCTEDSGGLLFYTYAILKSDATNDLRQVMRRTQPMPPLGPAGGKLRPDLIRVSRISVRTFGTGNIVEKRPFKSPFSPLQPGIILVPPEVGNRC